MANSVDLVQTAPLLRYVLIKIFVFNANSLDPDQMAHSGASELVLYHFATSA